MLHGELIHQFVDDLRHQRLRTTLTVLGITWGTVAVAVLLAFGTGFQRQMFRSARGIGDGLVIIFPGRTTKMFQGFPEGRYTHLREEYADVIAREVPGVAAISPEYGSWSRPTHRGTASSNALVSGVSPAFSEIRAVYAEAGGRFLDARDMAERRRVAFLGDDLKKLLFGEADAVGRTVFIGDVPFTVVGVMVKKKQDSSYNARDKDRVFIPASTFKALYGARYLNEIVYKPTVPAESPRVIEGVRQVLGRREKFDPSDHDAIGVWDTNEQLKMFWMIFGGLNAFLALVGSFTLLVGGIGVANIMYIVVRERTPEIGIKRSIGARRRDILLQFIGETFFIVGIGAALGLLLSISLVRLGQMLPLGDTVGTPVLSPAVLVATLALLASVAFLAAIFPARKAAALDPIDCLRG